VLARSCPRVSCPGREFGTAHTDTSGLHTGMQLWTQIRGHGARGGRCDASGPQGTPRFSAAAPATILASHELPGDRRHAPTHALARRVWRSATRSWAASFRRAPRVTRQRSSERGLEGARKHRRLVRSGSRMQVAPDRCRTVVAPDLATSRRAAGAPPPAGPVWSCASGRTRGRRTSRSPRGCCPPRLARCCHQRTYPRCR